MHTPEQIQELLDRSDTFVNEVLPQAGKLSINISNINELCVLIRKMRQQLAEAPKRNTKCCAEAELSYGNHHALECNG